MLIFYGVLAAALVSAIAAVAVKRAAHRRGTVEPRVVLHIGAGKSGSSAIQADLENRRAELRAAGVLVPGESLDPSGFGLASQVPFFEQLRTLPHGEARQRWADAIRELMATAEREGLHTIIVSAENLINPTSLALVLDGLDIRLEVVVYVRRQVEYFVSAWQQWYVKVHRSVDSFLDQNLGTLGNWNLCLSDWESLVGPDNITVRRFSQRHLDRGDVVADFCNSVGIPGPAKSSSRRVNVSYPDAFTLLAMRSPSVFSSMHDSTFYESLADLVGDLGERLTSTSFPFNAEQVADIERVYELSNEALRAKYFADVDGSLFDLGGVTLPDLDAIAAHAEAIVERALSAGPSDDFAALLTSLRR